VAETQSGEKTDKSGADISGGSFARNVFQLAGGAVIAQGLAVISAPIVARLYAPEAFGAAALFSSFIGILGVVGTWQYEQAIMLGRRDEESANIFWLCMAVLTAMCGVTVLAALFWGEEILRLVNGLELLPYIWLIPLGMFAMGAAAPLRLWETRRRKFGRLALSRIHQSLAQRALTIGFGWAGFNSGGQMILYQMVGWLITPLYLAAGLVRSDLPLLLKSFSPAQMYEAARRYIKFPLFSSWLVLLNSFSQQIPVFMLSAYFGAKITGYYSNSVLLLQIPLIFIGQAVSQVFFQSSSERRASGADQGPLVFGLYQRLCAIGLLPMAMIGIVGPDLFELMLGRGWGEAGVYSAILAPALFVNFLASPLSYLLSVLERQGATLLIVGLIFVARIAALAAGGEYFGDARLTVALYSLVNMSYLFLLMFIFRLAGLPVLSSLSVLLRFFAYALPCLVLTALLKWYWHINPWLLLSAAALLSLPYFALVIKNDERLKEMLLGRLAKVRRRV